jgi:hypothetical protein
VNLFSVTKFGVVRYFTTGIFLILTSLVVEAGTIDDAAFCVTDTEMQFSMDITFVNVDDVDGRLAALAQAALFSGLPTELIGLNMDHDCQVTRDAFPEVQEWNGTPTLDRFVNGLITDYTITSLGVGQCQFAGSVPHGADPFIAGDAIIEVFFREFNPTSDAQATDVVITDCVERPARATSIPTLSQWALILFSILISWIVFINRRRLF